MRLRFTRLSLILGGLVAATAAHGQDEIIDRNSGGFFPGGAGRPYINLQDALANEPAGVHVEFREGGLYAETGVYDRPSVISAAPGATAAIGVTPTQEAVFTVVSHNTHLAGCVPGFASWADDNRAWAIRTHPYIAGDVDYAAFQEVWRPSYAEDIGRGRGWLPFWLEASGGALCIPEAGLLTVSRNPYLDAAFTPYNVEHGEDSFANKGFLTTWVRHEGFDVFVINTHLQADYSDGARAARAAQISQLALWVRSLRQAFRSIPIVVMGDFNVYGEDVRLPEYSGVMAVLMQLEGLRDSARHFDDVPESTRPTFDLEGNTLARWFYPPSSGEVTGRLDYVLVADSLDGSVQVQTQSYTRLVPRMAPVSDDGHTDDDLSDHYPVLVDLRLMRLN